MSETDKRHLDTVRLQEPHPATQYEFLPQDVQSYISRIELETYDAKKDSLVWSCALGAVIGGYFTYRFFSSNDAPLREILGGLGMLVLSGAYWYRNNRKLTAVYFPDGDPNLRTNEGIRLEWELEYLSSLHQQKDDL